MPDLPQLSGDHVFLTDGGLETTLIFLRGLELPDFAAFPLVDSEEGRAELDGYFTPYLDLAAAAGTGFVLDTPTWRANRDWGARLGYDEHALAEVNRRAVDRVVGLADRRSDVDVVINGVIGPRGDGYVVDEAMGADDAADYHRLQTKAFAAAGAAVVTAVTMTYVDEAVGVVRAASADGLPVVVSFTVETDGRLPSGQLLADAVSEVDARTDAAAAYFMVNCAHPTHFDDVLREGGAWLERVKGVRANASRMSHAELDEAADLDRGDVAGLAGHYGVLDRILPDLRVVGGCCGTDDAHVAAMAEELVSRST